MGPDCSMHPCEGAICRGKVMPGHARLYSAVSCAKVAEPIEMPFGCLDSDAPKEACVTWGAHLCHLANTIEPSMCGGYVAFCQITLTTV